MDKGIDKNIWLYNLSYLMFVSNFKILGQVVLEKSLTKIPICKYVGVRDGKREK